MLIHKIIVSLIGLLIPFCSQAWWGGPGNMGYGDYRELNSTPFTMSPGPNYGYRDFDLGGSDFCSRCKCCYPGSPYYNYGSPYGAPYGNPAYAPVAPAAPAAQ
jgi:hypothetical protein